MKSKRNLRSLVEFFMREKDLVLFEETGIHLYDEDDIKWLDNLSYDSICEIYNRLLDEIDSDADICPQCIICKNKCKNCLYFLKYGRCSEDDTPYDKIRSISSVEIVDMLEYDIILFLKWNKS